jgi:tetratricopeptide (TPR) repeat protein
MLETMHEFALERLEARGEVAVLRRQHALFFLAFAEAADLHFHSPTQEAWMQRLDYDYDNLRAVLTWSHHESSHTDIGAQIAAIMWWYWLRRSMISEGRTWLERMIGPREAVETSARAQILYGAGFLAWIEGDYQRAAELYRQCLAHSIQQGDNMSRAYGLFGLGEIAYTHGDIGQASKNFEESLAFFCEEGHDQGIAYALIGMGQVAESQGDLSRALDHFERSCVLFRQIGETNGLTWALSCLGSLAYTQDDNERAVALYEESLASCRESGDKAGIARALYMLGEIRRLQGDDAQAMVFYDESLSLYSEIGYTNYRAWILHNLGHIAIHHGHLIDAAKFFFEGLSLFQNLGLMHGAAACLAGFAGVIGAQGEEERATRLFGAAEKVHGIEVARIGLNDPVNRIEWNRNVAIVRTQLDEMTFSAAWAEGQTMTLEQAVAYALNSGT